MVRQRSSAGASAQREYERLRAKYEHSVRSRHPHIGNLLLAIREEPQHITSWAKGADGERRLGRALDDVAKASPHLRVLHDRLRPGTRSNIDHLVVAPGGVYVIDAKAYKGKVTTRVVGPMFRARSTLVVGGRDQRRLIEGVRKQTDAVLAAVGPGVPVHPVICFVNGEWASWSRRFVVDGVFVTAWKPLRRRLTEAKPPTDDRIPRLAAILDERLVPAVTLR